MPQTFDSSSPVVGRRRRWPGGLCRRGPYTAGGAGSCKSKSGKLVEFHGQIHPDGSGSSEGMGRHRPEVRDGDEGGPGTRPWTRLQADAGKTRGAPPPGHSSSGVGQGVSPSESPATFPLSGAVRGGRRQDMKLVPMSFISKRMVTDADLSEGLAGENGWDGANLSICGAFCDHDPLTQC